MAGTGHPIFLDTQVFEAASFNFKTTRLVSLEEQVEKGNVRLIFTDITILEVKARIEKTVLDLSSSRVSSSSSTTPGCCGVPRFPK